MSRNTIGARQWTAIFTRHNGTLDATGNPTYLTEADWVTINIGWPCELVTVRGSEVFRGRQVAAETSHVLIGWLSSVAQVEPTDRVSISGKHYSVVSVLDVDGDNMTARVEVKREAA